MKPHEILATIMNARDTVRHIVTTPFPHDEELVLVQYQLTQLTNDIAEAQAKLKQMREAA